MHLPVVTTQAAQLHGVQIEEPSALHEFAGHAVQEVPVT